jgi:hypothetical protein
MSEPTEISMYKPASAASSPSDRMDGMEPRFEGSRIQANPATKRAKTKKAMKRIPIRT